jgi:mersacidin/lichenicidin family type 2 lantibiotic
MKGNTPMKFDVIRAWKDETYRQSLSNEELNMLPAHPAGELSETDLELVSGCGGEEGGFGDFGPGIAGSSSSSAFSAHKRVRIVSLSALACEANTFSAGEAETEATLFLSKLLQVCQDHQ